MKVTITIDTTEEYSNSLNLRHLINMGIWEIEDCLVAVEDNGVLKTTTDYLTHNGTRPSTAKIDLVLEK